MNEPVFTRTFKKEDVKAWLDEYIPNNLSDGIFCDSMADLETEYLRSIGLEPEHPGWHEENLYEVLEDIGMRGIEYVLPNGRVIEIDVELD